jgi:hypothetical protein
MAIRKLKPRARLQLPDTYFVTLEDLRKYLGLSRYSFEKRFRWYLWGFPQPVQLGTSNEDIRFRLDEIPNSGYRGTWLERFKARQASDFATQTNILHREATA